MRVLHGSHKYAGKMGSPAVALGNFDGVHLGHQVVLGHLVSEALKEGWTPAVYTFDPHPAKILSPKTAPLLLQTTSQKLAAFEKLGIRLVVLERFTPTFSRQTSKFFFEEILLKRLRARALCVGYDFTFGVKRSGTVEALKQLAGKHEIAVHVIQAQFERGTLISSTQIRNLIASGEVAQAKDLLGRPFALIGKVVKGHGIGMSQLGIHTANLNVENELLPKTGIYITRTKVEGKERSWPSATSVGFNPTFPAKEFSVETHLIGFSGMLLGKKIEVEFFTRLRDELTFPNAETLAEQIKKDIAEARQFHEALRDYRKTS